MKRRRSAGGAPRRGFKSHAGPVVVQKLYAPFFERRLHLEQRRRLRADDAVEGFHAPHRADGDMRGGGKPRLVPSQKDARRPQLSAVRESHYEATLA